MGVNLRALVSPEKVALSDLAGKTIAIDGYNTLHQFLSIIRGRRGEPLMDRHERVTSHLSGLLYRTSNLMEKGIRLVYVFDGEPPALKEAEIKRRMRVRSEALRSYERARERGDMEEARKLAQRAAVLKDYMVDDAKQLLSLMGVPWIQAPSEGEAQAAYLTMRGDAWGAGSQDFDALLFGTTKLVRNLSITGRRKLPGRDLYVKITPEVVNTSQLLERLGITRDQLIDIGMLVGTDYNPMGVKGVGPKTALKLIKEYGSLERVLPVLKKADFPVPPDEIRNIFLNPRVDTKYNIEPRKPLIEETIEFLCEERDFSEDRVRKALEKIEQAVKTPPQTLEGFMSYE